MRMIVFALAALLLLSFSYAQNYTTTYAANGWLRVERTVEVSGTQGCVGSGVSNSCSNTGAVSPGGQGGQSTKVTLAAKNTGQVARQGIEITESLSHVPEGASLDFSTPPSAYDGRQAVFTVASLEAGAEKSFSYSIGVPLSAGAIERIPDIQVSARQLQITIAAPFSARLGERVALRAMTFEGNALPNAVLYVIYPDGQQHAMKADAAGSASFVADAQGRYSYWARDYFVSNSPYTDAVSDAPVSVAAAATTQDQGMLGSILGALPILAGVFAFAVVALMVYGFISQRREEEELYSIQGPSSQMAPSPPDASPISYTQKFSFSQPEALREEKNVGAPEGPGGSGKMRLSESIARKMEEERGPQEAEETTTDEAPERAMTALERKASLEGELAEGESEIEKTISQLEEIRRKLQERRSLRESEGMKGNPPEGELQEEEAGEPQAEEGNLAMDAEASEEAAEGEGLEEEAGYQMPEEKEEDVPEEEFASLEPQEEEELQGMEKAKRVASAAKAQKKKPVYAKEALARKDGKKKKVKFATKGVRRR